MSQDYALAAEGVLMGFAVGFGVANMNHVVGEYADVKGSMSHLLIDCFPVDVENKVSQPDNRADDWGNKIERYLNTLT